MFVAILENNIGYGVTVGIERSTPHRLQTAPSIKTYDNKRYYISNNTLFLYFLLLKL